MTTETKDWYGVETCWGVPPSFVPSGPTHLFPSREEADEAFTAWEYECSEIGYPLRAAHHAGVIKYTIACEDTKHDNGDIAREVEISCPDWNTGVKTIVASGQCVMELCPILDVYKVKSADEDLLNWVDGRMPWRYDS